MKANERHKMGLTGSIKKISRLILKEKMVIFPTLLFAIGIGFGFVSVNSFVGMAEEKKEPVTIIGWISPNMNIENLCSEIEAIKYATTYREATTTLKIGDYYGEFTICGVDASYLQSRYGNSILSDMENDMPYILLEESMFSKLKNENGNTIQADAVTDYIMEIVDIGTGEKNARICGVIPEDETDENDFIYTTEKNFKKLMLSEGIFNVGNEIQISAIQEKSQFEETLMDDSEMGMEATINSENKSNSCLLLMKNGWKIEETIEGLQEKGIEVQISELYEDKMQRWSMESVSVKYDVIIGMILILTGGLIFYYQHCLWKYKHIEFLFWLENTSGSKRLRNQLELNIWIAFMLRSSLLGAGVFWFVWLLGGP